jgi:hypothetical protein
MMRFRSQTRLGVVSVVFDVEKTGMVLSVSIPRGIVEMPKHWI